MLPPLTFPPWYDDIEMRLQDAAGTIVIVLTIAGMFISLSGQIGDIRERITRVETVMKERLPPSRVIASQPPSERPARQPAGASLDCPCDNDLLSP